MSMLSSSVSPQSSYILSPPTSSEARKRGGGAGTTVGGATASLLPRVPSPVFAHQPIQRIATADGQRRTKRGQEEYMKALSDPATKSSRVSPVDFMVEKFSTERSFKSSVSLKKGCVIRHSNWHIEEKSRICHNRKTNRLMKLGSLQVAMMMGVGGGGPGGVGGGG
jgi:hypothetical protein